jgi:hypothetical protein
VTTSPEGLRVIASSCFRRAYVPRFLVDGADPLESLEELGELEEVRRSLLRKHEELKLEYEELKDNLEEVRRGEEWEEEEEEEEGEESAEELEDLLVEALDARDALREEKARLENKAGAKEVGVVFVDEGDQLGAGAPRPSPPESPPPPAPEMSFEFLYRLRVENHSLSSVQLLGRHWEFTDGNGERVISVKEPTGGVAGCHPVIPPGGAFE